jgi:hypothetical protein
MRSNWLTNCSWVDEKDKSLHIDIPRMLKELGLPDTPENRDAATQLAAKILKNLTPKAKVNIAP